MCGSLKLEGKMKFLPQGSEIPGSFIDGADTSISYKWDGFARTDGSRNKSKTMDEQWPSDKWKPVLIKVETLTERDKNGKVHYFSMVDRKDRIHKIAALMSLVDNRLKIMTKPANKTVGKVHSRMPVTVPETKTRESLVEFMNQKFASNYI